MQVLEVGKRYNLNLNIKMNNGIMSTDTPIDIVNNVIKNALLDLDITLCNICVYQEGEEPIAS